RWGGIKLIYPMFFHYLPKPSKIGVGRHSFEHYRGSTIGKGAINNIGMAGNPADICRAPIHIVLPVLKDVLKGIGDVDHISGRSMYHPFGFTRRSRSIENK